ncbi:hypothetical protein IEQ34_024098 [Dendrobium chrysotoxum]|uniref:Uncharacterized protein n=1 Tax=Dendrobium chrysotoxum TaxID=161865 RepID=A0AAV7FUE4_DENCH|nr:hypothetical protein IEQ34_024098 [Dendrobium chrysotoxum]
MVLLTKWLRFYDEEVIISVTVWISPMQQIGFLPLLIFYSTFQQLTFGWKPNRSTKIPSKVVFLAGQPLGYLSSWPLFAFAHHFIIWYAAEKVYPGTDFDKYAVLGVGRSTRCVTRLLKVKSELGWKAG